MHAPLEVHVQKRPRGCYRKGSVKTSERAMKFGMLELAAQRAWNN